MAVKKNTAKQPYKHDNIFFTKEQIKLGTVLRCVGRLHTNTLWEVEKIIADFRKRNGGGVKHLDQVSRLQDEVHLISRGNGRDRRVATFGALSYSAIWRFHSKG